VYSVILTVKHPFSASPTRANSRPYASSTPVKPSSRISAMPLGRSDPVPPGRGAPRRAGLGSLRRTRTRRGSGWRVSAASTQPYRSGTKPSDRSFSASKLSASRSQRQLPHSQSTSCRSCDPHPSLVVEHGVERRVRPAGLVLGLTGTTSWCAMSMMGLRAGLVPFHVNRGRGR
jgi:hypothetical protein